MYTVATSRGEARTRRGRTRAASLPASAPSRPTPIILVHGIVANGSKWSSWLPDLQQRGIPAITLDVPALGVAPRQAFLDAIDAARTTLLAREGLPPDTKVTLIGFSSGGIGSVEWLKQHPDLVDQVVTVSSPLAGNEIATLAANVLGGLAPEWLLNLSQQRAVLDGLTPDLAAKVTSIVGAPFDGIVTARSGRTPLVRRLELADFGVSGLFHPLVQERSPDVRALVWAALGVSVLPR